MPRIAEIMTTEVCTIQPQDSLRTAAQRMKEQDIGALPVCDGEKLLGMLTDRDLAIRGIGEGLAPDQACVSDVMSPDIAFVTADEGCDEVLQRMGREQLRRLPVIDAERRLVGIVSLGDLATRQDGHVDAALRGVSSPGSGAATGHPGGA
ncbi:CBS domain-containing protein [Piscinibacter sakaiensis]|uniref:CBS domain protein n=1 Tax=Piscinibacter sakaiensis TaxID=1547922 RepID=A0A0K8P802_PISS1|nr:CBS domain-containing protein [Piscinibacter sakaiensis]GAP38757.1 CBS domain protein [Piscinibacter sakaiensis]